MRCMFRVASTLALLTSVVAAAQEWQPPRTPYGQPDIEGFSARTRMRVIRVAKGKEPVR